MKIRNIICMMLAAAMLLGTGTCALADAFIAPKAEVVKSWDITNASVVLNRNNGVMMVNDFKTDTYALYAPDGTKLTSEPYIGMSWDTNMFMCKVESGVNKSGMLDGTGKLVVPMQYQWVEEISDRWQLAHVYKEGNFFSNEFKAEDGKYYKFGHSDVYFDGKLVGQTDSKNAIACGAYLYINGVGYDGTMTPSKYSRSGSGDTEYDMTDKGTFHVGSGQQVGVPECTLTPEDVGCPIVIVGKNIVDLQGNLYGTIEKEYDYVQCFRNGYAEVGLNEKVGLIDYTGKEVVPCEYDEFTGFDYFVNGYMIAVRDGKVGYLNEMGMETCEFKYTQDELINYNWSPMTYKYNDDGSITVISAAGGELTRTFENVDMLDEGCPLFAATVESEKAGVFDLRGQEIIRADGKYTNVYNFSISYDASVIVAEKEFGYSTVMQMSDAYGIQSQSDELPVPAAQPAVQAEATAAQPEAPAAQAEAAEARANARFIQSLFPSGKPAGSEPAPEAADEGWTCTCGSVNDSNFCPKCGAPRPEELKCANCGFIPPEGSKPNFCSECGNPF